MSHDSRVTWLFRWVRVNTFSLLLKLRKTLMYAQKNISSVLKHHWACAGTRPRPQPASLLRCISQPPDFVLHYKFLKKLKKVQRLWYAAQQASAAANRTALLHMLSSVCLPQNYSPETENVMLLLVFGFRLYVVLLLPQKRNKCLGY